MSPLPRHDSIEATHVDAGRRREGVVGAEYTWDVRVAELCTRLVYTEELELRAASRAQAVGRGSSGRGTSRTAGGLGAGHSGCGRRWLTLRIVYVGWLAM